MKKSNLVAMILGVIGGGLFSIGLCMTLLPQWQMINQGIGMGAAGLIVLCVTVLTWRRMEHKPPFKPTAKGILSSLMGLIGSLLLGVGMCMTMLWSMMVMGIAIGMVGIVVLLMLIPYRKGVKSS